MLLGCTHYVFLKSTVRALLPETTAVLDGNEGTVRQLQRRMEQEGLLAKAPGKAERYALTFHAAGEAEAAARARSLQLLSVPE